MTRLVFILWQMALVVMVAEAFWEGRWIIVTGGLAFTALGLCAMLSGSERLRRTGSSS